MQSTSVLVDSAPGGRPEPRTAHRLRESERVGGGGGDQAFASNYSYEFSTENLAPPESFNTLRWRRPGGAPGVGLEEDGLYVDPSPSNSGWGGVHRLLHLDLASPPSRRLTRLGGHCGIRGLAAVLALCGGGICQAIPPQILAIEPTTFVQGTVPQPDLVLTGSNFVVGIPSSTNRPTVTLTDEGGAEYSSQADVNFSGTTVTLKPTQLNLLPAPPGVYDVTVSRPDGESYTLPAGFSIIDTEPEPEGIHLKVRSVWGGPVTDVDVVGDTAYVAAGRRLVILDAADPTDSDYLTELGSLAIMPGVEGVVVRDGYAFLAAAKPYRFCVADISDPTDPKMVWAPSVGNQLSRDVFLYGNFAYVLGAAGGDDVFEISDPINVAHLGLGPDQSAEAMAIAGDLLYVCEDSPNGMLRVYDLSTDPVNPTLRGSVNTGGWRTTDIAIDGAYAYVAAKNDNPPNSVYVVDVSDPAAPVVIGSDDGFIQSLPAGLAVSGGFVYVADDISGAPENWALSEGLVILDAGTDPANPTRVGSFKTHGNVRGVKIIENRAYLFDDGEGLIVLDLSDPTSPVRLGNYHSPAVMRQMVKSGDHLFVADAWNGFTVLDVADPAAPDVVGVYLAEHYNDLGLETWGIDVKNDTVYLGAGYLGLEMVDVSSPTSPELLGAYRFESSLDPSSRIAGVTVSGSIAHVGFTECFCEPGFCACDGIFLNLDVGDPQDIFEVGRVSVGAGPLPASRIAVSDQGIAFLAHQSLYPSGSSQVTIDTSDPTEPTVIHTGVDPAADVALDGNTLFIADDSNFLDPHVQGLWIQDVAVPANPVDQVLVDETYQLGGGVVLDQAYAVATQNQHVYVAGRGEFPEGGGIGVAYLLDATDPTSPVLLDASPNVGSDSSSVCVDEPHAFITNTFQGPNHPAIGLVILEAGGLNPADLDGDGLAGVIDLLVLLGHWGTCPDSCPPACIGDIDADCNVGVIDLLILLANWD